MSEGAPRRIDARALPPGAPELDEVVAHLRAGGLLAYPTETVYGFGCALAEAPLARLRALKGREGDRPFLLLVSGADAVPTLGWTDEARELASVFWPGSLTLVLADADGRFPPAVRSAAGAVAVRRTSHPLAATLVEGLGAPLTSTSANPPGGLPAASGEEALAAALAVGAGMEMWALDAGALPASEPSTIVDCTGRVPRVLRAGATPVGRLRCVLPKIESPAPEPR